MRLQHTKKQGKRYQNFGLEKKRQNNEPRNPTDQETRSCLLLFSLFCCAATSDVQCILILWEALFIFQLFSARSWGRNQGGVEVSTGCDDEGRRNLESLHKDSGARCEQGFTGAQEPARSY